MWQNRKQPKRNQREKKTKGVSSCECDPNEQRIAFDVYTDKSQSNEMLQWEHLNVKN